MNEKIIRYWVFGIATLLTCIGVSVGAGIGLDAPSYADMNAYNMSGFTITLNTEEIYENITNMNYTHLSSFTFDNNSLIPDYDGIYKIDYSISFSGQTGSTHGAGIGVNGVIKRECYSQRKLGSIDVGNMGSTCIIALSSGDKVTLMADIENTPVNDVIVYAANVAIINAGMIR